VIGAIADDVTGATDVAVAFRRHGLRTQLIFGVPTTGLGDVDAVVIALHIRMIEAAEAVAQAIAAWKWLRDNGITRTYFKYCSTFDSTPHGNIGPVLDALSEAAGARTVVTTPSSPEHGRTQYAGYLFVGDQLLADSPMRHHPVTPMTESHLPTLLRPQTRERIDLVPLREVRRRALSGRIERGAARFLFVDALTDDDLVEIGRAVVDLPLSAGAAGLAGGIAAALAERKPAGVGEPVEEEPGGRAAVLSGSCSARTLEQVEHLLAAGRPAYFLDVLAAPAAGPLAANALAWYDALSGAAAPLIYSSVEPDRLRAIQNTLGAARAAGILEEATGRIARGLVERGVTRIVTAGGETSGAVVTALGVDGGLVGAEAARGVPWIHHPELTLLLKSGNFGEPDLLTRASA
jgi:uncharacterized protein YgbK (DUF1537 family)